MIEIEFANRHPSLRVAKDPLVAAARQVLEEAGFQSAQLSLAVVDDSTIHALNRQYLDHDYPTDVLSFTLEHDEQRAYLEGEVIVSADTAATAAAELGWPAEHELLLYVVHGTLHLVGHDDHDPDNRRTMEEAQWRHLAACGVQPPQHAAPSPPDSAGSTGDAIR